MARIYFATDVHGSEQVWRKWINAPEFYKADILLLCGDLTGKAIIFMARQKDGTYKCRVFGREHTMRSKAELRDMEAKVRFSGYYPYVVDQSGVEELMSDKEELNRIFERLMTDTLRRWLEMAEEKVPKDILISVMPGNDDDFILDPVIEEFEKSSDRIVYPLKKVVNLCYDYEMISMDYTNPTPWDTPRECSEEELWEKLIKERERVKVDHSKVICNFHCPPWGTRLDIAPRLDKNLKPIFVLGTPVSEHVGSKSVKRFLKEYQPLLGLHGHIHESYASDKIGKTLLVNPGSEYTGGILRGFIVDLSEKGVERYWKVEG